MAKFLDKKERVIDFQLTPYGKYKLSVGKFKPDSYAFFDTGVLYDSAYGNIKESQNNIHERVKNKTQFIEGILLFEEAENSTRPSTFAGETILPSKMYIHPDAPGLSIEEVMGYFAPGDAGYSYFEAKLNDAKANIRSRAESLGIIRDSISAAGGYSDEEIVSEIVEAGFESDFIDYLVFEETSLFDLDIIPEQIIPKPNILSFQSAIGDAKFEGENTQAAPAWKLLTCQGEITKITPKDTTHYDKIIAGVDTDEKIESKEFNIPQIDINANYALEISSPSLRLERELPSEFVTETQEFAGGNTIKLVKNDLVVYAEEMNTELLTENFDVEIYEMIESAGATLEATGSVDFSAGPSVGDTITISDGIKIQSFKFVTNTAAAAAAAAADGHVAIAVPTAYTYLGNNKSSMGSILNFVSALRLDNGTPVAQMICVNEGCMPRAAGDFIFSGPSKVGFNGKYPTPNYRGSRADGSLFVPSDNKGRCRKLFADGVTDNGPCYRGNHDLDITVTDKMIDQIVQRLQEHPDGPFDSGNLSISILNNNVTFGDPNTLILQSGGSTGRYTVHGFFGGLNKKGVNLQRKYFLDDVEQIVDGLMVSANKESIKTPNLTQDSVEYYFNVLTDNDVDAKIACSCANTFNKNSYYIDIDFDCVEEDLESVYYDIYGTATVPEICAPSQRQIDQDPRNTGNAPGGFAGLAPQDETCDD